MDDDYKKMWINIFLLMAISAGWVAWFTDVIDLREKAAKTQCARFHPETGEFEWIQIK